MGNDRTTTTANAVFPLKISVDQHLRLTNAPVPPPLVAVGIERFTCLAAVRFAVISYLAQPKSLPSATLGTRAAGSWIQVNLPTTLAAQLKDRAVAENRSKSSIVRAALELCWPPDGASGSEIEDATAAVRQPAGAAE